MISELFAILVLQCGLSPKYILDEMQFYEMESLMDNLYLINQQQWEMTRNLAYFMVQPNTKQRIKPEKLMKFPWDSEGQKIKGAKHGKVDPLEAEMLEKEAKMWEEKLFGKGEDK